MPPLSATRKQQHEQLIPNKGNILPVSPLMQNSKRIRYPLLVSGPVATPSRKKTSTGKKVAFCVTLKVEEIIHISDYSLEEMSATWYDAQEIKSFKEDRKDTAKRIDQGATTDSDYHRGVESLTIAGARIRYEHILVGVNSVLDEQELQDLDGKENPEMLAHIYRLNTRQSEALAHERGLSDQREVMLLEDCL